MSASWFDYDGDGRPDLYVVNMWTDAGQRVIRDRAFTPAQRNTADAYRRHTNGQFALSVIAATARSKTYRPRERARLGRWAWAPDGHDFDNDGHAEIFITCGMLTNESGNGPEQLLLAAGGRPIATEAKPSAAYENGWNAINQFIREDYSWNGREPNVLLARKAGNTSMSPA